MNKKALLVVLLLSMFIISSCSIFNVTRTDPEKEQYYKGSKGLLMRFVPGSPPPRMFYFSDTDNQFEVNVEIKNDGASDTKGGLFISGYDPDLIMIEGVDIERRGVRDCTFDLGNIDLGEGVKNMNFYFNCFGIEGTRGGQEDWSVRMRDIGRILGIEALDEFDLDISIDNNNGNYGFGLGFGEFGSLDVLNYGRTLILALSSLNFEAYNGREFILNGDNYEFPGGDATFVNWQGHITHNWPTGLDDIDQTFLVTSCYSYSTFATPQICIDPQPYSEGRKVCRPGSISYSGNQGAPIAITSVDQQSTPRNVILTFHVKNVGGGEVFNAGYLERCSPWFPDTLSPQYKNEVYIGRATIGQQRLDCNPAYKFRLQNGVGQFTCVYDLEYATASSAYETAAVVELWYGYQETMQQSVRIKRAG